MCCAVSLYLLTFIGMNSMLCAMLAGSGPTFVLVSPSYCHFTFPEVLSLSSL